MQLHANLNIAEAIFWVVLALVIAVRSRGAPPALRPIGYVAAVAFFAFAGTDLVEAQSGAWYRPWWLLVYNAVCVTVIAGCLWQYRKWKQRLGS